MTPTEKIQTLIQVIEVQIPAPIEGTTVVIGEDSQLFVSPWTESDLAEFRLKMKELVNKL